MYTSFGGGEGKLGNPRRRLEGVDPAKVSPLERKKTGASAREVYYTKKEEERLYIPFNQTSSRVIQYRVANVMCLWERDIDGCVVSVCVCWWPWRQFWQV